jgi:hypothetical protein
MQLDQGLPKYDPGALQSKRRHDRGDYEVRPASA